MSLGLNLKDPLQMSAAQNGHDSIFSVPGAFLPQLFAPLPPSIYVPTSMLIFISLWNEEKMRGVFLLRNCSVKSRAVRDVQMMLNIGCQVCITTFGECENAALNPDL